MIKPLIHPNGTSGELLETQYGEAHTLLRDFTKRFETLEFNPRDYYPIGVDAYQNARQERQEVFAHMKAIDSYLHEIRNSIADQL